MSGAVGGAAGEDLYAVLGVGPEADPAALLHAYRQLARQLHPDAHPGGGADDARFKRLTAAYQVLSDPDRRAAYDAGHRPGARPGGPPGDGGRGAARGGTRPGAGTGPSAGTGRSAGAGRSLFRAAGPGRPPLVAGAVRVEPASPRLRPVRERPGPVQLPVPLDLAVGGGALSCRLPDGRDAVVTVPAGVADGALLAVADRPVGPVQAVVRVQAPTGWRRMGDDLHAELVVSYPEAVLGAQLSLPSHDGQPLQVSVPPGTRPGTRLPVPGRGMPTSRGRGDLLFDVRLYVPEELTGAAAAALGELGPDLAVPGRLTDGKPGRQPG